MKISFELNEECLNLHSKAKKLFIFDNDDFDLFMLQLFGVELKKVVGMKTINKHTFQISYYIMPNDNIFAVAYATNEIVDFIQSTKDIKHFFNNIESISNNHVSYLFYLELLNNGYSKRKFV
jgi:hypothetical protein